MIKRVELIRPDEYLPRSSIKKAGVIHNWVNLPAKLPQDSYIEFFIWKQGKEESWVKDHLKIGSITNPNFYPKETKFPFHETIESERTTISLPLSEHVYYGGVYFQNGSSCTAWAIANGYNGLGIPIDVEYLEALHKFSIDKRKKEAVGMLYTHAIDIQSHFPNTQVEFRDLFTGEKNTNDFRREIKMSEELDSYPELYRYARSIKEFLDNKEIILTSVQPAIYIGKAHIDGTNHAIAVLGYKVYEKLGQRIMDVQVADPKPEIGLTWMSIEHLVNSMVPGRMHSLKKKISHNRIYTKAA